MSTEPQNVSKDKSSHAERVVNLLLGAEIGHRSRREGFPVESREQLDPAAISKRREFLRELSSGPEASKKFYQLRE